jgi:intracellular multiplication protein IcmE
VEGLGNAMMNSNTTNYSNGSGMSSFTHLNLGEQMGAAAGTMGQQLGQLIQKNTPQQATVILKQNDDIGIIFDEPVYRS